VPAPAAGESTAPLAETVNEPAKATPPSKSVLVARLRQRLASDVAKNSGGS
jgi:hypothetical protein